MKNMTETTIFKFQNNNIVIFPAKENEVCLSGLRNILYYNSVF